MNLKQAYQFCQDMAKSHYENFPVASVLLPKKCRRPISVIYAFARTADDFADEGNTTQQQRLQQLNEFSEALEQINQRNYHGSNPIFIALTDVIDQYQLPISLFADLLDAFKQDVVKDRYQEFNEVSDYCRRSANPVGRLILLLSGHPTQHQLQQSDNICTSLQLINFYQDISQDLTESDRIYIPTQELQQFHINEIDLNNINNDSSKLAPLLRLQYQRTHQLMLQGYELGESLKGRIGWEIRAMTLGGIYTLQLLMRQKDQLLLTRPRLSKWLLFKIMLISILRKYYHHKATELLTSGY